MDLDLLVDRLRKLVDGRPGRAVVGITGAPGAGKSTLAESLVAALVGPSWIGTWVAYVPMDGFHLADVELTRLGLLDRKGAPETFDSLGYAALLGRLRTGDDEVVYAPGFERDLEQPIAGSIPVLRPTRLVITEGNYLLHWPAVRAELDEVWFCEVTEETRLARLVARHERFGKSHEDAVAWAYGTDQRNADLVATTRPHADLVIPMD